MREANYYFRVKKLGEVMHLYVLGDLHLGSENFLKEKWKVVTKMIKKDPLAYVIILGDITDDDRPTTRMRRKMMFNDRPEAFTQEDKNHLEYLDRHIIPQFRGVITEKNCLGVFDGDHYRQYHNGLTSVQYICSVLKLPYLGDGEADIDVNFKYAGGCITKCINARHGQGFNKSPSLVMRRMEDIVGGYENYDIFLRGHAHTPGVISLAREYRDRSKHMRLQREILLINTMSFRSRTLVNKTDYAEEKEYKPTSYRLPIVIFKARKKQHFKLHCDVLEKFV